MVCALSTRRLPGGAALALTLLVGTAVRSEGQPPSGYYTTADASSAATLRTTVHAIIDDHTRFPYTSSATDTWDILNQADQDPGDSSRILDVYMNASYPAVAGGNDNYNREHTWPKSYGFPTDNATNYPFSDTHALFLADSGYNSSRGNTLYLPCDALCAEKTTVLNDGAGGGSGTFPGNSNWRTGSGATGQWRTWIGRQGDVARALLYLDVRYRLLLSGRARSNGLEGCACAATGRLGRHRDPARWTTVSSVDFLANGALLATDTSPPFELLFTAPAGVGSVTFSVVVHDGVGNAVSSSPVIVPIDADLLATVRGRVVDAQGLPVTGAVVSVLSEGLLAEYFDFTTPLEEIPDLVGLTPDRVTRVTALNLRNPDGIFGVDPLGIPPVAPDYAARYTGWLTVPVAGSYTFFLGADEGARLSVDAVVIADISGDQHRYQEVPAAVDLQAGLVPIEVVFYESVGSAELQLSWAPPDRERQVIAPVSLVPALRPFVTLTDANGFFSVADVPTALDDVRVQATVVESSLSSATSTNLRLTGGQAVDVGDLVIP